MASASAAVLLDQAVARWNEVHDVVSRSLKACRLSRYSRDCTRDLLLLSHGLRSAFIADVTAPITVWRDLLLGLRQVDARFGELGLLDLCDEGCVFFHIDAFRTRLSVDYNALGCSLAADSCVPRNNAAVDSVTVEFVNVHAQLVEPEVLTGDSRRQYREYLLEVVRALLAQWRAASAAQLVSLQLPPLSSSDDPLVRVISSLSLTTLCGYLLEYPVLYCSHAPSLSAGSAATAASSLHSNNLGMKPLVRHVASIPLLPGALGNERLKFSPVQTAFSSCSAAESALAPSAASSAASAAAVSTTLICSFTVPAALASHELIASALSHWTTTRRMTPARHANASCWDHARLSLHTEAVTLPVVAL